MTAQKKAAGCKDRYLDSPLRKGEGLMAKKKIQITETVLRDAHQSLIATRMPIEDMIPILEKLDKVGFYSLE